MSLPAMCGKRKHNFSIVFSIAILKYSRLSMSTCNSSVRRQAIKASHQHRVGRASLVCAAGRGLGKGDEKQLENMQGSPKGC